ncbi:ComF family protein [Modicisalibacter sp. 'Wilcox']|uniref:ComF family protein n=1 Tax=Modicisalibacter sp. 'Wilcox' TaxID=2679914 RepID=UPI001F0894F2|nr:ComF family protein [Modicisalibacter sp. 'Wilcox']
MIGRARRLSTSFSARVDRGLRTTLPGGCAFCLGPCPPQAPWCEACLAALPWNRPACRRCAEPLPPGAPDWCGRCLSSPPAFDGARVGLRYESEVAALLQRFKFAADPRAGTLLVALMARELATLDAAERPELLIALPRHRRRAREAGLDTGPWLTARLARTLGLPWYTPQRRRDTPTQRGLDRRARRRNLRDAFVVGRELPARVALVDDVMTTGASLGALAEVCREAGAQHVEAWAAARTPLAGGR